MKACTGLYCANPTGQRFGGRCLTSHGDGLPTFGQFLIKLALSSVNVFGDFSARLGYPAGCFDHRSFGVSPFSNHSAPIALFSLYRKEKTAQRMS